MQSELLASTSPRIIAIVGMPGSGKSEVSLILKQQGFEIVRFGQITDDEILKNGLSINPENEKIIRERLRNEHGKDVYAKFSEKKILDLGKTNDTVIIDGLLSWQEYKYLLSKFSSIVLVHIFASPSLRYKRLSVRKIRPLTGQEARSRDFFEIENIDKGGPIAMADYVIENSGSRDELREKIEIFLEKITK